jgi:two-component system alkaline phosphatase synthesis response regulator PhoP
VLARKSDTLARMCAHVVVAEDDPKQARVIAAYLERDGHSVCMVGDGVAALREVRRQPPDLLVLDVMMPEMDGLAVLRTLRRESDLPVLMLTARSTEDDLVSGLHVGADDYLTKPFSPRELSARVEALLRRTRRQASGGPQPHQVGGLTVDPTRYEVRVDDRPVECTPLEFRILATLAASPGQVFTRRQLLDAADDPAAVVTERAVDVHVMNLRRKIEVDPRRPRRLTTVYGVGYKLSDGRP